MLRFFFFFYFLIFGVKVIAQKSEHYSMIITMKDGVVLTIGTNDVDSISFSNGQISIKGTNITEMMNLLSHSVESVDSCQKQLDVHDSLICHSFLYKIDNIVIDNPSRDGSDYRGSRTIVGAGNAPYCSGDRNVIFGTQNLHLTYLADKDKVANRNVAIGYHSQFRMMDGANNVSVGNESLDNISHGEFNTAVGSNALRIQCVANYGYTTEGETINHNTAVGGNSMYYLIGNRNVGIGYNTLSGNYGATGSYNMAIGTDAGAHHHDENFSFYLDNIPRLNNTDEKEKGLIYGKFDSLPDNQRLRINAGYILFPYLPRTDPHVLGALWNDNGYLKISEGIR